MVIDVLRLMERKIDLATTHEPHMIGENIMGVPIASDDEVLEAYGPEEVELALGVGAPRLGEARKVIWSRFEETGYRAVTLIHPSSTISSDTVLEKGAQVMAGAVIQSGSRIGAGAIINTGATVDHDCYIGPFAHIAPGATLCGNVRVGENSLIGAGATIVPGVTIDNNSLIAAGTTVKGGR